MLFRNCNAPKKVVHNKPYREWAFNSSEMRIVVGNFRFVGGGGRSPGLQNWVGWTGDLWQTTSAKNHPTRRPPITIKTLLNKVHPLKRFVYHSVARITEGKSVRIVAEVRPRSNSKPRCSGCNKPRPGYDHMPQPRSFEFIPIYNIPVVLSYTVADHPKCTT